MVGGTEPTACGDARATGGRGSRWRNESTRPARGPVRGAASVHQLQDEWRPGLRVACASIQHRPYHDAGGVNRIRPRPDLYRPDLVGRPGHGFLW